jgi:LuxR family transcriptional regulator, maltose regulon positive regulatory protein
MNSKLHRSGFNNAVTASIPRALRFGLERPHLVGRLAMVETQLVALIAPSGYGKTVLLSDFSRSGLRRVVWVSASRDLNGVAALSRAILRQLLELGLGLVAPQSVLEDGQPENGQLETRQLENSQLVSAVALARVLDQSEENLNVVLDGLDVLEPAAVQWVQAFALALADGHRVFVAGHEANGLPLARLISDGQATLIGINELAFTSGEVVEYLRLRQREDTNVSATLEGWPVAISLAASSDPNEFEPSELLEEGLARLSTEMRASLLEASVLEVWTEDSLRRVGAVLPSGWLRQVRRSGLPISPVGKGAFRPHPVLLEALDLQLRILPLRYAELHSRVAHDAERSGDLVRALRHFLRAGLEEKALALAEETMFELELRRDHTMVRAALEHFAEDRLTADLRAALAHALIETGEPMRGELILRDLQAKGQAKMRVLYALAELAQYRQQKQDALRMMAEGVETATQTVWRSRFQRLQVRALLEAKDEAEVVRRSLEMLVVAERENLNHEVRGNLLTLQIGLMGARRWQEAERTGFRGIRLAEADGLSQQVTVFMNNLAEQYRRQDRLEEAVAMIDRAITLAESIQAVPLPLLCETRAELRFRQTDFERAVTDLQTALRYCGGRGFDGIAQNIRLKLFYAAYRIGRHDLAAHSFARVREDVPESGTRLYDAYRFYEGVAAFLEADLEGADSHFAVVGAQTAEEDDYQRSLIFRAEIARRQGRLDRSHLASLIEVLNAHGNDGVLRVDAALFGELYAECLNRGWWPERFVAYASASVAPVLEVVGTGDDRLELRLQSLGAVQASIAGSSAHIPLAKAGELLVWLAIHGPASRDQLVDALWDGSNEQRHIEYFKIAVRRLRASFAEHASVDFNPLTFEQGLYRISERLNVQLDAMAVAAALQANDPFALEAAVLAHQGVFLPACESEWASEARMRFQEEALEAAMALALRLEADDSRRALELRRAAVRIDPLHEVAHVALLRSLMVLGDQVSARVAYKAYARMLEAEFGGEPDEALRRQFGE